MTKRILVVEDDHDIQELLKMHLELQKYEVIATENGLEGLDLAKEHQFDLLLIDRMIPGMNGINLVREVRKLDKHKDTPIIFITALTQSENVIEGLDAGADDYINKPFDLNILNARIRAQLRRKLPPVESQSTYTHNELVINKDSHEVKVSGNKVNLTSFEFNLLEILIANPGKVFSRDSLIKTIQGDDVYVSPRTVDTHMAGLRKKIHPAGEYIETIRGIGYKFIND